MPTEILEQICKLLTIPDQARFIAVCKSWRFANSSMKSYHWIPDAPWLVNNDCINPHFQVISTTDKQAYNIYKPFNLLQNTSIVGSLKGWLILKSDQSLFILNLFSKLRLDLPSIRTMPCFLCSKGDDCFGMHTPLTFTILMCPNMNPTLVTAVTYKGNIGWCKVGDTTWKRDHTSDKFYSSVIFHDNKLYAAERGGLKVNMFKFDDGVLVQVGSVESINPIEHAPNLSRPIRSYCMTVYLVECGQKVFVVKRFFDDTKFHTPTINYVIFAVEENNTTPQLVKVDNLDDHILFVANLNIECLDAKYCPMFQRGSVYFTCNSENSTATEIGVFSISNKTIHQIPITNPQMHSSSSIWMMPRFSFDCNCEVCTYAPWFRPRELRKRHMQRKTNIV
ncbi:putative F-box protein At5g66830 [Lotus japonicus]|uniref:putative F-box protein At5g66830 n=1 Tax=Lotus japonicus TaxID=34305 RepID=UPI002583FD22|nr:putative F-box protein At5g66830 [Lotus japonicus]